jgi:hypothetical protein
MAVSVKDINFELSNIVNRIDLSELNSATSAITDAFYAATSTQLGGSISDVKGGFESLVQTVDDPSQPAPIGPAISRITPNVPGVKADLLPPIPGADQSDLGSIVEGSVTTGLLDEIIVAGTPESVATALNTVLGKTTAEITDCLQQIAPIDINVDITGAVDNVLQNVLGGSLANSVSKLGTALTTAVGGLNSSNILKNIVENYTGNVTNKILNQVDNPIEAIVKQVAVLILEDQLDLAVDNSLIMIDLPQDLQDLSIQTGITIDKSSVAGLLASLSALEIAGASSVSIQSVINKISSIQTAYTQSSKITNNIVRGDPALGTPSADRCVSIGTQSSGPTGAGSSGSGEYDTDFSYIDSLEEMTADLRAITRPVSTTIVHWTANYIDDNHIDSQAIKDMHVTRGWSTIGYHYIIRRDGSLQRGRNPNRTGAHAKESHNPYSIGISFVAGYNCPNGTRNPEGYVSPDSINSAQWATLDMYLKAFYTVFSGGEVWGHQDTDPWNKIDPMVNMSEYVRNKFGKTNISPQPSRTYTLEELAARTFDPIRTTPI